MFYFRHDGKNGQTSTVVQARLADAQAALQSKTKSMEKLDACTKRLKLFVKLGGVASEINDVAKAVLSIVKMTFDVRVNSVL